MKPPTKFTPKIVHSFEIEEELFMDLDFNIDIPKKNIKKKVKITEIKKRSKNVSKFDSSDRKSVV